MFSKTQFQTLFRYHWHITTRLLDCAARLSTEDYTANPGYGHGSIHDLLSHLLRADLGWRLALETGKQQPRIPAEAYPTLASLSSGFADEQAAWNLLLERLSSEEIEGIISLVTLRGQAFDIPRWRVLQHLVLHGMQQQTEVAQLLTAKGQSPGDIDFIFFE